MAKVNICLLCVCSLFFLIFKMKIAGLEGMVQVFQHYFTELLIHTDAEYNDAILCSKS